MKRPHTTPAQHRATLAALKELAGDSAAREYGECPACSEMMAVRKVSEDLPGEDARYVEYWRCKNGHDWREIFVHDPIA